MTCQRLLKLKMQKTAVSAQGTRNGKAEIEPSEGMDEGKDSQLCAEAGVRLGGGSQQPN